MPNEGPRDTSRWISEWQERIVAAAQSGNELDTFRQGLEATEELEGEFRVHAQFGLWDAAIQHEVADRSVLAAIYTSVVSGPPPDDHDELDAAAVRDDERRGDDAEIERLSRLPPIEYERERAAAAERLGCRMSALDDAVRAVRRAKGETKGQGRPLELPEIEPWHDSVDGQTLLNAFSELIRRFVVLRDVEADAVALWCVATHTFQSFEIFPRLTLRSATPRCGKTTLRDVVSGLVPKPLLVDSIMAAALFRTIEILRPTLLLDEAETYLGNSEELRGIINSGHRRNGNAIRCVGDSHEPRQFSTWAPVLLAQIGTPPATVYDRSIVISLRRKKPSERAEPFSVKGRNETHLLARQASRWTRDCNAKIASVELISLGSQNDRANDNWHPLFAVAEVAGGQWPQRARHAAVMLVEGAGHEGAALEEMLIADIFGIFEGGPEQGAEGAAQRQALDRISSAGLAEQLAAIDQTPVLEG